MKDRERKIRQKQGRKSYYYKFFLSFIIVLFAPILTVIAVFTVSHNLVREQIVLASSNTLYQFFNRVDAVLGDIQEICLSVANNEDYKLYSKKIVDQFENRSFNALKLQQHMSGYLSEKTYDIFEYYPSKDYVISARTSAMNLRSYYEIYYEDVERDFWNEFKYVAETSYKKPMLFSMNRESSETYLCLAMRQKGYRKEQYDRVIVVVLNPQYVKELLEDAIAGEQNGISLILDDEGKVVFSTDNVVYTEHFQESVYMIQEQESKIMNVQYAYAVPDTYFLSKLFKVYTICGIGIAISIVLGLYVAHRQTKKMYQPVEDILIQLRKHSSENYDAKEKTEFEFIQMLFEKEKKENVILNQEIRYRENLKRNNFILSLLNGTKAVNDKCDDIFKENGITLISNLFCVLVICFEDKQTYENELSKFIVVNVFEELYNREFRGYALETGGEKIVVLMNLDKSIDRDFLIDLYNEGKTFINKHFGIILVSGIGGIHEGLKGVQEAYQEAESALKYKWLFGTDIIIDYFEIANRKFECPQKNEYDMYSLVMNYLMGDKETTSSTGLVQSIVHNYNIGEKSSLEMIEFFRFEVISLLHRCLIREGLWSAEWQEKVVGLLDTKTFEDFKIYLGEIFTELYIKRQECAEEQDVCIKVKKYIDEHYSEEQLSRSLLSEMYGVAPGYLSKLFKEKFQFTIPEYISKVRVDTAKIKLINTTDNVWEIAEQTGFVNSASFIRTFKRQEGVTPNIYRELSKN